MIPSLVIDCSITMAWCFEDERTDATARIQDRLIDEAAIVPVHWSLEVINVLAMAEKQDRISASDSTLFVGLLPLFDIQVDDKPCAHIFGHVLPLCREHGLTSYDAAYLELALRWQVPLATLDRKLRHAAAHLGVETLGT